MATTYDHINSNRRRSVLLIVVFFILIVVLGWTIDKLQGGGGGFIALAALIGIVMSLVGFYSGDAIALRVSGAQPITKEQSPYVYRMVENLAIANGMPMPKLYVIPDPTINAFATGRDPKHASVAVTTGAIESLENEELEGVLAHELSHIKNFDIRFMMLVTILAGMIVLVSDMFWRSQFFGGHRRSDDRNSGGGALMIVGLALLILSPIIAQLTQLAVSRRREFLADASGALLTRYPEGLAGALEKIEQHNTKPMVGASNATAHLFLSNPFGKGRNNISKLFNTHPPVVERVKALRAMGGLDNPPPTA